MHLPLLTQGNSSGAQDAEKRKKKVARVGAHRRSLASDQSYKTNENAKYNCIFIFCISLSATKLGADRRRQSLTAVILVFAVATIVDTVTHEKKLFFAHGDSNRAHTHFASYLLSSPTHFCGLSPQQANSPAVHVSRTAEIQTSPVQTLTNDSLQSVDLLKILLQCMMWSYSGQFFML